MAIKGGDLIHVANQILIDRAQTAGPGQVNINSEKIYELGNYKSLATVYDTPDLTWNLESFDARAEFEAAVLNLPFNLANGTQTITVTGSPTGGNLTLTYSGQTTGNIAQDALASAVQTALVALSNIGPGDVTVTGPAGGPWVVSFGGALLPGPIAVMTASGSGLTGGVSPGVNIVATDGVRMAEGTVLDPAKALPMDIASIFKPGFQDANPYDVVGSAVATGLVLESLSYRFGISENARQTAGFRGDSIYYLPQTAWIEETAGTNAANQQVVAAHPPVVYRGDTANGARYALRVSLASGKKLSLGADYTEAVASNVLTVTVLDPVPTTDKIRITYASTASATYPQLSHALVSAVAPAALRGRNIKVKIGGVDITDAWTSIQSINIDWKVTLEKDEELGNPEAVAQTFDVPEVSGALELKPRSYQELYQRICRIAGVTVGEVAGSLTTIPLPLYVELHSPDDGTVLKTLEVPDARFTLPGFQGQAGVGQKINVTFNFSSDTGTLLVYKGARP